MTHVLGLLVPVCIAQCKYSHGLRVGGNWMSELGVAEQFEGRARELLGASRAFNTMKVLRSALTKVSQIEDLFGLDLRFPWSMSAASNFVMGCIELNLKANTIR